MQCRYLAPLSLSNIVNIERRLSTWKVLFPFWFSTALENILGSLLFFSLLWCLTSLRIALSLCVNVIQKLCSAVEIWGLSKCSSFLWCYLSCLCDAWNSFGQKEIVLPTTVSLLMLKSLITSVRSYAEHRLLLILGNLMSCRDDEDSLLNNEDIASLRINFGTYLIFLHMRIVMECYYLRCITGILSKTWLFQEGRFLHSC